MTDPRALVRPLEDDWRDALDAVARTRAWPTSRDVAKLGARVADLSRAYNDPSRARAVMADAGAARLGFSFPRDVPKGAGAVRELVATRVLRMPADRPLRVLDIGAGLGATTWGVARALEAAGGRGVIEATWLDTDAQALDLGAALVRARQGAVTSPIRLEVKTRVGGPGMASILDRFDLVLLGQLLSEMDVGRTEDERRDDHADLLRALVEDRIEERGAVVVIEPALRDRTRHLHRVRDAVLVEAQEARAQGEQGVILFAPCLHEASCPALAREFDWCHEDLAVDLPTWLVPVARAAGLRHEGLTFSYLVLTRQGPRLVDTIAIPLPSPDVPMAGRLRVVSESIRTKGKREAFVCGELMQASALPHGPADPGSAAICVPGRVRLMRLDRDGNAANSAFERFGRGDLLVVTPAPDLARPRIGSASIATRAELRDQVGNVGPVERDPVSGQSESR